MSLQNYESIKCDFIYLLKQYTQICLTYSFHYLQTPLMLKTSYAVRYRNTWFVRSYRGRHEILEEVSALMGSYDLTVRR